MKKVLSVLLAVVMAFSVIALCASAEDVEEPTGTVYTWPSGSNPLSVINKKDGKVVPFLQDGDVIQFDKITGSGVTAEKPKIVQFIYYPDAASITTGITNVDWKENKIPQYNLDTKKWNIDTKNGDTVENHMAKSPKYYKTFISESEGFVKGQTPSHTVIGLNAGNAIGRDSALIVRGEGPIDYALEGANFLGWVVYKVTWSASNANKAIVELYALWDRNPATPDDPGTPDEPDEPDKPDEPDEPDVVYDNPIQEARAKVIAFFEKIWEYVSMLGGLGAAVAVFLEGTARPWLYEKFGIEA